MRITVRLFGTLPEGVRGYDRVAGLTLDLPDDATVGEVIDRLAIAPGALGVVTVSGRVVDRSAGLRDGVELCLLQSAHGG